MNVNVSRFQKRLIRWFEAHKRPLPWRLKADPYRIFVVEVMLQQTQIKTVIPYYERWLKAFPNVKSLARAPIDKVLKLWEGLGYYTRARNLHKTAQEIVNRFGGKIPSDSETLMTLPGIGRYTAGAISSIAFQKPVPLVDGNVARVFSRLFNIKKDISKPETQKQFYAVGEKLVPRKNPGIFNQALMELGSLVCVSEIPKCSICPVKSLCLAFQKGDPAKLPIRSKGAPVKKIDMVVGIVRKNGKILIRKRPDRGIWGGLWEIPGTIRAKNETFEEALTQEFKETMNLSITILKKSSLMEHRFTHRRAFIHPFFCEIKEENRTNGTKIKWANAEKLKTFSFPVPHQKILAALQ